MAFSRILHRLKEAPMNKKYIVRLTDEERVVCEATVKNEKGKSEKLRRAMILLKTDADGPGWNDEKISEAVGCRVRTVENVRRAFVLEGFEAALCAARAPGTINNGFGHTVTLCAGHA